MTDVPSLKIFSRYTPRYTLKKPHIEQNFGCTHLQKILEVSTQRLPSSTPLVLICYLLTNTTEDWSYSSYV